MAPTGTCRECGGPFIRMNKRRVLCTECQILRDMDYRPTASKVCADCGRTFYPVRLSYKICNHCREYMERPEKYPACAGCSRHNRPAPGITTHCMTCVQLTPEMRTKYLNRLRKVVGERGAQWRSAGQPGLDQTITAQEVQ